jgi:hypothetical protein
VAFPLLLAWYLSSVQLVEQAQDGDRAPTRFTVTGLFRGADFEGSVTAGCTWLHLELPDGSRLIASAGGFQGYFDAVDGARKGKGWLVLTAAGELRPAGKAGYSLDAASLSLRALTHDDHRAGRGAVLVEGRLADAPPADGDAGSTRLAFPNRPATVYLVGAKAGVRGRVRAEGDLGVTPAGLLFLRARKVEELKGN